MKSRRFTALLFVVVCLALSAADARAQRRGGGGVVVGRAVPRSRIARPVVVSPRITRVAPYRPSYYPYRRGLGLGFYTSFGYPYYPYYGYPYYYSYFGAPYYYGGPYGYPAYGYPAYGYPGYGYPGYGYSGYGYAGGYGGVRIQGAPKNAQVFADGYYVGIVDDFDGAFQHLNLEAGAHQIEIRIPGQPPLTFEVNVQPGQTLTIHAR